LLVRLTGKSRNTLHSYIRTGKLSTVHNHVTDSKGIDTSELLRVFGELKNTSNTLHDSVTSEQSITSKTTDQDPEKEALKAEINRLKSVLAEKDERINDKQAHIDSLNSALLLLKHDRDTGLAEKENNASKRQAGGFLGWFKRGNKK